MKSDLPKRFREGDELTATLVNGILEEIWRWRNMEAMPPIHVSETNSKFGPPVISFFSQGSGEIFAGDTGDGFIAGTPESPAPVSTACTIYLAEAAGTPGWTNTASITTAYNIYANAISGGLTAYYWKSPDTENYYIITADC